MMNKAFRYPLSFVRCYNGASSSVVSCAWFFASFRSSFLLIDLYFPREAPLSDDLERFPRLFRDPRLR
jgi:hypothetical protein